MEGCKILIKSVNGEALIFENVCEIRVFQPHADRAHLKINHEGAIVPCDPPTGEVEWLKRFKKGDK